MANFKETCTTEQFDTLHDILDKTRKNSEYVKVPREAFAALLIDHGQLHAVLKTGC
jgi:hypothetical protein